MFFFFCELKKKNYRFPRIFLLKGFLTQYDKDLLNFLNQKIDWDDPRKTSVDVL